MMPTYQDDNIGFSILISGCGNDTIGFTILEYALWMWESPLASPFWMWMERAGYVGAWALGALLTCLEVPF